MLERFRKFRIIRQGKLFCDKSDTESCYGSAFWYVASPGIGLDRLMRASGTVVRCHVTPTVGQIGIERIRG